MKTKHTRGQWIAVGHWIEHVSDKVPDIANFDPVSMGQDGRSSNEICANAMLCAAAPELLAACQLFVEYDNDTAVDNGIAMALVYKVICKEMRDAIGKATGKAV